MRRRGMPKARGVVEFVVIVVLAILLMVGLQAYVVKPYKIPSGSMIPTLDVGQRILVNRIGMRFGSPHIGEVMVFHPPANYDACANPNQGQDNPSGSAVQACDVAQAQPSSVVFVKRVVGLPGDRLSIVDGHVIRDGKRESDPYITGCSGQAWCNFPGTIVVPKGDYYMMGDNRSDSEDSRFWGPVPRAWLIGEAFFTYWPLDRVGFL